MRTNHVNVVPAQGLLADVPPDLLKIISAKHKVAELRVQQYQNDAQTNEKALKLFIFRQSGMVTTNKTG